MKLKNGLVTEIEDGVPGLPRMNHLTIQRACDRFLMRRGLITAPSFRRSAWLYGRTVATSPRRVAA
jgi:hypothetical protein